MLTVAGITSIALIGMMIRLGAVCVMRVRRNVLAVRGSAMSLRDRIATAIRRAAASQTYWVPGPYVAKKYADAVIAELGLKNPYCNRCGSPHDGRCLRDE